MAIRWDWEDKIGELIVKEEENEFNISIYEGNALAIFIYHYEENGEKYYTLFNFFGDKVHLKNCVNDKSYNVFRGWQKVTFTKVNTDIWHLIKALVKANVTVEIKGA